MLLEYDGTAQRRRRLELNMPTMLLAVYTNRSVTTITDMEHGRVSPKVDTASAVAEALGVELSDLLRPCGTGSSEDMATTDDVAGSSRMASA